jgi:XRE family transcriptional regulator, regulator of sulfur utilization
MPQNFQSPSMSLGKSIRKYRNNAGLKQKELASLLNVSVNYMSLVENDKREPSLSFIKNLASELQIPVGFLFLDVDHPTENMPKEASLAFYKIKELMYQIEELMPNDDA